MKKFHDSLYFFFLVAIILILPAPTAFAQSTTFNGTRWASIGGISGANDSVQDMVLDGSGNLYIGGDFTMVGNVPANRVAKWDGSSWSALGSGLENVPVGEPVVLALAVFGGDLYVGGYFETAGGVSAKNVAKWDGNGWSALGSGVDSTVLALAVSGSDMFVGGYFSTAGDSNASYIAKWDGSGWSPVGLGMNNPVNSLVVSGSDLYAGGYFTVAGGIGARRVAKWDGSNWSALGSGLNRSQVTALAVLRSDLYVAGDFTTAGGSNANYIAKWNGTSWSALGAGLNQSLSSAMAVSGDDLFVGGSFTSAGGVSANRIARWNGSEWSALGSGLNGSVVSLAVSGSDLIVGGFFTTAGGIAATNLAKVDLIGSPPAMPVFTSVDSTISGTKLLLAYTADPGSSFLLSSSTNMTTWKSNTMVIAAGDTNSIVIDITNLHEFFRLEQLP